jgi:2-polyprenyl-3-methyl-5-hydroxy-6-metoxy-1,4-benzoquinol methylase
MRKFLKKFIIMFINLATRIKNPMVRNEFFLPTAGLNLGYYIQKADCTGAHHLLRYEWAVKTIVDLNTITAILDIACGSGYGSFLLAREFPNTAVTGVDYDPIAIKIASETYSLPNLHYQHGDMTRWNETFGADFFDCIVCFDTLEHVNHREIALENLVNHIRPNGSLFFSTPSGSDINNLQPAWPYHKIEYSSASLYDLLRRYFRKVIAPENPEFPHREVFDQLKGSKVDYLLRMNPVVCRVPIIMRNPYRLSVP